MHEQSWHEAYRGLLTEILNFGVEETNARTKTKIKMLAGGHAFKISLSDGTLPVVGNRRYYPHIAAAETAWQFMGTKDPSFILSKAPKLWSKFVEDGELKTAYGWRWREAFGRDQISLAIDELINNPTNRQLFISAWDPATDGLGGPQPKNIPCPVGFSLSTASGALHMSVFIRSSDVFVGLPYDVMCYGLTLDAIAASAGLRTGSMTVCLGHPHLYEPHFGPAIHCTSGRDNVPCVVIRSNRELYSNDQTTWTSNVKPHLPAWSVEEIVEDPDGYVNAVKRLASRVDHCSWDPHPVVVE